MMSRVISRLYDQALRPLGLKSSQLSIMALIAQAGAAGPGEIGRSLRMEPSTVSRNVARMRANGWLRDLARADRRAYRLTLTPAGERLLVEAFPAWEQAQQAVASLLGETETHRFRQAADALWRRTLQDAAHDRPPPENPAASKEG
jgi:DNA-binding MarR family transcriptional regulator